MACSLRVLVSAMRLRAVGALLQRLAWRPVWVQVWVLLLLGRHACACSSQGFCDERWQDKAALVQELQVDSSAKFSARGGLLHALSTWSLNEGLLVQHVALPGMNARDRG